eukprot:1159516-Pelagomonas_calceolata.AAC.18
MSAWGFGSCCKSVAFVGWPYKNPIMQSTCLNATNVSFRVHASDCTLVAFVGWPYKDSHHAIYLSECNKCVLPGPCKLLHVGGIRWLAIQGQPSSCNLPV